MSDNNEYRLVVGMSRAGTTALVRTLNLHGGVAAFGETCFWGNSWVQPVNGLYGRKEIEAVKSKLEFNTMVPFDEKAGGLGTDLSAVRLAIHSALDALELPATPDDAFRAICQAVTTVCGKCVWVEKTPHHLLSLDRIMAAAPGSRVVIMLRRPEEFLLSYKHQGDRKAAEVRRVFLRTYHPAPAAFVCRGYLKAAREAVSRFGNDVKIVWLTDLECDPCGLLADIAAHLRLPGGGKALRMVSDNSSFEGAEQRPELAPEELFWLRLVAGRQIRQLGLDEPKQNSSLLGLVWSIFRLIPWMINFVNVHGGDRVRLRSITARWLR